VVGKYFAITMPFLLLVIWFIQRYYLRTSRQVRLLDIEAKSPLYTHFCETIAGISTIKAYGWQSQFQQTCDEHVNTSQRPYYTLLSIQKWLAFVLDLVVAVMAVVLVSIATFFNNKFSPAEIGVGLNLVLTFNDALAQAISSWTQLETSMGAVKRVQQFQDTTPSEKRPWVLTPSLHDWPNRGDIVFDHATAFYRFGGLFPLPTSKISVDSTNSYITYSSNKPPALENVNLTIKSKEKLAICGSSGSGKTSLVLALLQMIDVRSGSVTIDGRDLSSLQPSDVRSRINVIPQDPFFFPGTVGFNLNPTKVLRDNVIESALRKVGLWEKISLNGGLDADLQTANWSAGERQLLALARSLTSASPIVILDEATSS
jgi:ATP-binding cassette subfamily C (CFTR/MRP) protein 1